MQWYELLDMTLGAIYAQKICKYSRFIYVDKYHLFSLVNTYLFFVSIVKQVFQFM